MLSGFGLKSLEPAIDGSILFVIIDWICELAILAISRFSPEPEAEQLFSMESKICSTLINFIWDFLGGNEKSEAKMPNGVSLKANGDFVLITTSVYPEI
jgi:hypothetical protein